MPELSIAENILLHAPPMKSGFLQYSRLHAEARPWLEMVGLSIDPRTPAKVLSPAQGQLVEVARALAREARVLLLDEPTASLTEHEAVKLFELLRSLRDGVAGILFVSHKLSEVFALCDQVSVLRDGQSVLDNIPISQLTHSDVIKAMVGRDIVATTYAARNKATEGPPMLELRNVASSYGHEDISLQVHSGRIVGLYGLVGAGRTELAKAILGIHDVTAGELRSNGTVVRPRSPFDALRKYRIGYVTEDRKAEGVILSHSVAKNVAITIWDKLRNRLRAVTPRSEAAAITPVLDRVNVKRDRLDQPVAELSGGNQQKVSVAKWLASDVDVLLIDEPTISVDLSTKQEIYKLIDEMAEAGKGLLVISSDLEEIVRIADTILVMANKRIVFEVENAEHLEYRDISQRIVEAIVTARGEEAHSVPEDCADPLRVSRQAARHRLVLWP